MGKATRAATVSTKRDADRFRKAAATFAKHATASKKRVQETLVELGTHTEKGRIRKQYR